MRGLNERFEYLTVESMNVEFEMVKSKLGRGQPKN